MRSFIAAFSAVVALATLSNAAPISLLCTAVPANSGDVTALTDVPSGVTGINSSELLSGVNASPSSDLSSVTTIVSGATGGQLPADISGAPGLVGGANASGLISGATGTVSGTGVLSGATGSGSGVTSLLSGATGTVSGTGIISGATGSSSGVTGLLSGATGTVSGTGILSGATGSSSGVTGLLSGATGTVSGTGILSSSGAVSSSSVAVVFSNIQTQIAPFVAELSYLTPSNCTITQITTIVSSIKGPIVAAIPQLQGLSGQPTDIIFGAIDGTSVLSITQLAGVVTPLITLILTAIGNVLPLLSEGSDVLAVLTDLGNVVFSLLSVVISLVGGLVTELTPALQPVVGVVSALGITAIPGLSL